MNKNKIWSFIFLIIMINGVFASSIDVSRLENKENTLYFEGIYPINYEPYNLTGCYTESLAPEAVEKLWKNIIETGFQADVLTSNQPENQSREKMENNELLITTKDSKAGDITGKKEVPNEIIHPLEIPTILGQVCYGPFSHGLELKETLRVGRCEGGEDYPCYLENEGLFRQNGKYGFFPQTVSVGKDLLRTISEITGLKEAGEYTQEIIDPSLDFNTNVDLGLFSDMSYNQIAQFRQAVFSDDENISEVQLNKFSLMLDKAVKNSILTTSFNASMETTCNSDNCYINTYSLFDKIFNQYYSANMVFTSVSPILWNATGKIFRYVPKKLGAQKLILKDSIGGIRGKHGFIDNFLNKNMSMLKAARSARFYKDVAKNTDKYISSLATKNSQIIKNINRYDMKPQFDTYLESLKSGKNLDAIKNEFFESGIYTKLNKSQKRVLMESVLEYNDNIKTARMIQDLSKQKIENISSSAMKTLYSNTQTLEDFYSSITKEQYNTILEETARVNKLNKEFSNFTTNKVDWMDGSKDISYLKERGRVISGAEEKMSKIKLKGELYPTEIVDSKSYSSMILENPYKFDGTDFVADGYLKNVETKTVLVNFLDGPANIDVIVPYAETISTTLQPINLNDIEYYLRPDIFIEYQSKAGVIKTVRGTSINFSDIDTAYSVGYRGVTEDAVTDLVKYGISPLEASHSYFNSVGVGQINSAEKITDGVLEVMRDQGWTTGKGVNYLNQRMKQQKQNKWVKQAFNILIDSGEAYLYNFSYWQVKSAGANIFGNAFDRYSMIRLPETYTSVIFKHDDTDIYNDSYIDFFSNDGSDQGDLFKAYLNSILFWLVNVSKTILENTEWKTTQGFSNWVTKTTEGHIRRSSVDSIALYTDSMKNNCDEHTCQITVGDLSLLENTTKEKSVEDKNYKQTLGENIRVNHSTANGIKTTSYILENTSEKNLEKYGQTLISFSHHTNYDGSLGGYTTLNSINLQDAINQEETCSDKLKNLEVMGMPIGWTNQWTRKSYRTGAIAAGFSMLAYYSLSAPQHRVILGMVLGDVIPQALIMPEIYGCVDHEEGYYSHFFIAKEEIERIEKDPKNKVGDAISKGSESMEKMLTNITKNTELEESIKNTSNEIKQFAENKIKDNPIMQARFETQGTTNAVFDARLFFVEIGENANCKASAYNDKGVEHLIDQKTGENVVIDKEKGVVDLVDKEGNVIEIISEKNKDWVRLIATNLGIPAKVIPHRLSYIPVPDTDTPLFYVDVYGNLKIEDIDFLNCLKNNYFEQTGLEMQGNVLTDYLGSVKQVTTTNLFSPETQFDIFPKGRDISPEIIAEGNPRHVARGEHSKIVVQGNRVTKISPIENKEVTLGKNIAIQFERGQMIYSGEKNSYIMWVQQTYVMHQSEIKNMDVTPTKVINPVTGCEDYAFDMSVTADSSNPEAIRKAQEMNKALEKIGPFQMFDTPSKTFIFYTTDPPECEKRIKIIDKKTGQVLDHAIESIITTPDGFVVKTDDGREHNFEFNAEDGVPKLKYNDATETLLSAQGKNGTFWYDPNTGNWYTENGHMIPLNPKFNEGITFKVGEDGKVSGTPVQYVLGNPYAGGASDRSAFNIPLAPTNFLALSCYVLIILGCFVYLFEERNRFVKKKK